MWRWASRATCRRPDERATVFRAAGVPIGSGGRRFTLNDRNRLIGQSIGSVRGSPGGKRNKQRSVDGAVASGCSVSAGMRRSPAERSPCRARGATGAGRPRTHCRCHRPDSWTIQLRRTEHAHPPPGLGAHLGAEGLDPRPRGCVDPLHRAATRCGQRDPQARRTDVDLHAAAEPRHPSALFDDGPELGGFGFLLPRPVAQRQAADLVRPRHRGRALRGRPLDLHRRVGAPRRCTGGVGQGSGCHP